MDCTCGTREKKMHANLLWGNLDEKVPRLKCKRKSKADLDVKEIGWHFVGWICLAQPAEK